VESAPSFSRRVVVVSSRVLLPPPSPGRKRRATHRSERETESAVFADNTKKVKSNLSGKEKKPSRDISLSLSLSFPFFVASRDESEEEQRLFSFIYRVVVCRSFSGRFLLVLRDESATRFGSVLSERIGA